MAVRLRSLFGRTGEGSFGKTGESRFFTVLQSELGRYFVGRTGILHVPAGQEALVTFDNPRRSGKRAMVVAITLTSDRGRRALFLFDATVSAPMQEATKVANAHRGRREKPRVVIGYKIGAAPALAGGIDVFERLLEGQVTLNTEQEGRYIFEPGRSITVRFPAIATADQIDVAYGWWEEPLQ